MEIRSKSAAWVKPWAISVLVILLIAIGTAVALPFWLTAQLPQLLAEHTGRKATLGGVRIQWWPLQVGIEGLQLQEANGQALVGFDALQVQVNAWQSLSRGEVMIGQIALQKPVITISQSQDGTYNFQDLLNKEPTAPEDSSPALPINIARLAITEGKLAWQSNVNGKLFSETITPINLQLANLSTSGDQPFSVQLSLALLSGGQIDWQGTGKLAGIVSEGRIKIDNIALARIKAFAPLLDVQGNLAVDSDYQFSYADQQLKLSIKQAKLALQALQLQQDTAKVSLPNLTLETDLTITTNGEGWQVQSQTCKLGGQDLQAQYGKLNLKLPSLNAETAFQASSGKNLQINLSQARLLSQGWQLQETGAQQPLLKLARFDVQGLAVDLGKQSLAIKEVTAKNADLSVWLTPEGQLNWAELLAHATPAAQPGAVPTAANPVVAADKPQWSVTIGHLLVDNFNANFEDRSLKKPTTIQIKAAQLSVDNLNNQAGSRLPFALSVGINKSGTVKLNGNATLEPPSADMTVAVQDIELEKYQAYYDKFIRVDILDGGLNIDGTLAVQPAQAGNMGLKFRGNVSVADLLTRDQKVNKDFVKWKNFSLQELDVDTAANRYTANALTLERPYARVTIRKDKSMNFQNLIVTDAPAATPAPKPDTVTKTPEANKILFKLAKINIIEGSSDFTDLSLILPFAAHIKSLDGGATGIASGKEALVKVALSGNAYELAPVTIKGEISPAIGKYDVQVSFNGLPMPLVSPYMVQFAGYKVEKGKMTLDLNYSVADKKLTASNKLMIDQFELGDKVDNPNAVTIPIKLAVALLKDSSGKIKFDVPVTGSLEDPRFNLGAVIADAFMNSLSKIAASPFNAIASLFGGEAKSLSSVNFAPGSAKLEPTELEKLEKVAKALQARKALSLEVKGAAFQDQDWLAIRHDALFDQLKNRRADELNKKSTKKIRPEYVELSDDDYKRLLADMFIEKFPLLADKSFFGTPMLKNTKAGDFYEVAKQKLYEVIEPEEERLKGLAVWRAQAIAKYMVEKGGIDQARIYILDTAIDPPDTHNQLSSFLSLTAN
ncbi:hypothetical protein JCM14076_22710 [Methylosoma difficile]